MFFHFVLRLLDPAVLYHSVSSGEIFWEFSTADLKTAIEWMNELMNEWIIHLYRALLCIVLHPKRFTIMWGGLSSTTTSVQHPLGWCDGWHRTTAPVRSPHQIQVERRERVIEPIKWIGIIRRPWLVRSSSGNLARTPGLHPYFLREVPWDF